MAKAPQVILSPTGIHHVVPGGTVHLQCNVSGRPPPRVVWFKNDISIRKFYQENYKTSNFSLNTDMFVKDFSEKKQATYKCVADNDVGVKVSKSVQLVLGKKDSF